MWAWPGLLLALTLLHVGGAESEGGGRPRCQAPPTWRIGEVEPMKEAMGKVTVAALFQASWLFCLEQAGRMDSLRQKLESQGLRDMVFMVINHQGALAQRLHPLLAEKLSANITLYKQADNQPDVWQLLKGEKDDFFIYDRCGRLTQHISLPYSIIGDGHVEKAIRDAYCARTCGDCTYESTEIPEECRERPTEAAPTADPHPGHHHPHHGHHHHHQHGHHHGHHGAPPALGRHDGHERHHGNQQQAQQESDLMQQVQVDAQVAMHRPWAVEKAKWKSKHSWQWATESENDAAPKASWCWHWRRLFGEAGLAAGGEPVGQWHCVEALPASWQWHGLQGGGHVEAVTETWQWRAPPADWPQPRPAAPWAWPPNVQSWEWQQV